MNSSDHTFYFIRFPLAAGGTHLANLISLDETFTPRVPSMLRAEYIKYLYEVYSNSSSRIVHLSNHHIISNKKRWGDHLNEIDYSFKSSVHIGHAASFDWSWAMLSQLQNKKYISISFNDANSVSILQAREQAIFNTNTFANGYYLHEAQHYYNRCFYSSTPEICDEDINLFLEVQDLFQPSIEKVLNTINLKFKLNVPYDLAQELHSKWFPLQNING